MSYSVKSYYCTVSHLLQPVSPVLLYSAALLHRGSELCLVCCVFLKLEQTHLRELFLSFFHFIFCSCHSGIKY